MTNVIHPFAMPDPRPDEAAEFLRAWHAGADPTWLTSIVQMKPSKSGGVRTLAAPLGEIIEAIETLGLGEMIWSGGDAFDLYTPVGFLTEKPRKGFRSGISNVRAVGGVWLDLDVGKPNSFRDETECLDFAMSLGIRPTILVATGTGGVHTYWKTDRLMSGVEARELCEMWYIRAREVAAGVALDKLVNQDRVMRLPGSVRFPKKAGELTTLCRLLDTSGPVSTVEELRELTRPTWEVYKDKLTSTRRAVNLRREELDVSSVGDNRWATLALITRIEDLFNESFTWQDILIPHGWIEMGEDSEHRTLWSRPEDGTKKSATTGWPESPYTMSLFSTSPATGLLDLYEAGVPLTMYRCHVQLTWHGDEAGFIAAYLKQLQGEAE